MLIETSAWLDYLYYNRSPKVDSFLDQYLAGKQPVDTTPIIYQEVLQGIRKDKDFRQIRQNFASYRFFQFSNQQEAAEKAATIYRDCRKKGLTIRKAHDCMIALVCLEFDLELLHLDRDFDAIAQVYPLRIISL